MHHLYIMQIYNYTSSQCKAAEAGQLPERGVGKTWLLATFAQQHLKCKSIEMYTGQISKNNVTNSYSYNLLENIIQFLFLVAFFKCASSLHHANI